jgi:outer membrane scaffolding protein for murein synthesis (MipA/OmpV family)
MAATPQHLKRGSAGNAARPNVVGASAVSWRAAAVPGLALAAMCCCFAAHAKEEPLWEFGFGAGAVVFEDYRGSDSTHAYPLPVPYLLYNGKFLKSDRDGVRGTLFNQDRLEINLSFTATTPVRSDRERNGMPDLRSTVELGPSVNLHLWRSDAARVKLDLRMPLRAAFTVQASPKMIGWTYTPQFALDVADPFGYPGWNFGMLAGPLFADRRYHEYFYSVAPQYATASRPEYAANGGYAGTQFLTAVSKRYPKFWVGAYARYDTLSGATFADSPLVQRKSYWSAGFGFAWMIHRSSQVVEVPD